jgi:hypothetical protein
MEPAWTQFESAYKDKLEIVYVNVDERSTKEFQAYSSLVSGAIPHTVWVTQQNKELSAQTGGMTFDQLKAASDRALANSK